MIATGDTGTPSPAVPYELRGHEPVAPRRPFLRPLGYGLVTMVVAFGFLLQILNGVCPVP